MTHSSQRRLPDIVEVRQLIQTERFCLESVDLCFSNGQHRTFERFHTQQPTDAVMIVAVMQNAFVLVREYAVGVEAYTLGFSKGQMDAGELVLQTADRELREETGLYAKHLEVLTCMTTAPGISSNKMHVVLARDLHSDTVRLQGDEPEPLEVVHWPCAEYRALLRHPEFHESRSIAALLWYISQCEESHP